VNSERQALLAGLLLLAFGGAALRTGKDRNPPEVADAPTVPIGGFRTAAADWLWLENNLAWEVHDAGRVRWLINLTLRTDPESRYFWLNSARTLAYDLPEWRARLEPNAPAAARQHWRRDGAEEALRLLDRGLRWHWNSTALYLEKGSICLYGLGDRTAAAECFRLAAAQADAPEFAKRIWQRLSQDRGVESTTR
jgi:hypothetical protein